MTVAIRRATAILLVATSTFVLGHLAKADDAARAAAEDSQFELPVHLAEATWSLLEVIEQHDISAPSRESLIAAIAEPLVERLASNVRDAKIKELARLSREEFTAILVKDWQQNTRWRPRSAAEYFGALRTPRAPQSLRLQIVPAAEYAVQEQLQNNRYVGLGVNVGRPDDGHLTFQRIVPGGAADRAGLIDGETVLAVDGRNTAGVPMDDVVSKWLRGPRGTQVTLTLAPNGKLPQREVTMTRSVVRFETVHGRNGTPVSRGDFRNQPSVPVGYLDVGLGASTLQELRDAEVRLRADGIRVLILDFRSRVTSRNFHHARILADGLLDGGTIWSWQNRSGDLNVETADRECLFRGMPLVVMIDDATDATTMHVAAALQDAGRATIVGEAPDAGGLIEEVFPFLGGQYYVVLQSARLFRSRPDRSWPLSPDEDTGPTRFTVTFPTELGPNGIKMVRTVPPSPEDLKFIQQRGVDPKSQSVSALFPANIPPFEAVSRMAPNAVIRLANSPAINRQTQYEVTQQAALRLLKQLDQPNLEASR